MEQKRIGKGSKGRENELKGQMGEKWKTKESFNKAKKRREQEKEG